MLNGLQITTGKWHSGLTQQNHLASAFLTQPHAMNTLVTRIFGGMQQATNPMQYLTGGTGRAKEIPNREYTWMLQGDDEKAIAVIGNLGDAATDQSGKNRTVFRVKFAEKWFANQDVLAADDRFYRVRVMEDPYFDGDGWVYTLKLTNPDPTATIPDKYITAGAEFSKEYTTVPEMSTGGNTTFSTPFKMRNHLTTLRKSYTVTRSASTDVLTIALKDPQTEQTTTTWVKLAEWEAIAQWYKEIERSLWYSTFSADAKGATDMMGDNGLPVYEGAGIDQQIAPANVREYTELSETIIRNFMIDLSYNTVPESNRHFVAFTGEFGFAEFDKAMKNSIKSWNLVDTHFVSGSGQDLQLGGQFKTYMGLNGTKLTLTHLPLLDNTVIQRQLHYKTGRPLSSYDFYIMDFGMKGGESNIQKVYKKDSEMVMWHTAGSVDPYGNTSKSINTMRSNNSDGYSVHMLAEIGIQIANPMACGKLKCVAGSL